MGATDSTVERLFIAVPLTEPARNEIVSALPALPGRLVAPQNWHFTLRFLGDTEQGMRDALAGALRGARLGTRFRIRFSGLGAFPRPKRARIIWLGVDEGARQLISLADIVESTVRRAGFPAELRPFKPHLTLSRIEPSRSVVDVLAAQQPRRVEMPVTDVVVVRSELGGGPARHEVVQRYTLAK
jgi:2'-5' RNA ligase